MLTKDGDAEVVTETAGRILFGRPFDSAEIDFLPAEGTSKCVDAYETVANVACPLTVCSR